MEWHNVSGELNKLTLEHNKTGTAWITVSNSKAGILSYITVSDKRKLIKALQDGENLELDT